jgi:hypothetical protein
MVARSRTRSLDHGGIRGSKGGRKQAMSRKNKKFRKGGGNDGPCQAPGGHGRQTRSARPGVRYPRPLAERVCGWLACRRQGRETARMEKISLDAIAREQATRAAAATSGHSAGTVYGEHEHALRQTVLALTAGSSLDERESPGRPPSRFCGGGSGWQPGSWPGKAAGVISWSCRTSGMHCRRSRTRRCC